MDRAMLSGPVPRHNSLKFSGSCRKRTAACAGNPRAPFLLSGWLRAPKAQDTALPSIRNSVESSLNICLNLTWDGDMNVSGDGRTSR